MKQDIKEKWVTALRSGKYQQGRFLLRSTSDLYCCLGVLCDVSGLGDWKSLNSSVQYTTKTTDKEEGISFLPREVAHAVQLYSSDEIQLSKMNDAQRMSFEQIANYIENKL